MSRRPLSFLAQSDPALTGQCNLDILPRRSDQATLPHSPKKMSRCPFIFVDFGLLVDTVYWRNICLNCSAAQFPFITAVFSPPFPRTQALHVKK